ncbi:hypothetical protein D3C75_606450 [compost metagenome]
MKMEYIRITDISDPLFRQVHNLLSEVFPPEEVLEFSLWQEPLEDPGIRVFAAVHQGEVVGTTEYRYYPDWNVAMTDFTIIGREGLGIGRFLARNRLEDLNKLAADNGKIGRFLAQSRLKDLGTLLRITVKSCSACLQKYTTPTG